MKPSTKLLLAALRRGEVLTPIVSLHRFGIHALSQRIGEIRTDPLVTEEVISERVQGDVYHRYYMPAYCRIVSTPTPAKATPVRAHVRLKEITEDDQMALSF